MKIVIDMPRDFCEKMRNQNGMSYTEAEVVVDAFYKGTPLPKGHGRLIDADELKKHKYHDNNRFEDAVAIAQVDWADTIIEAESEE